MTGVQTCALPIYNSRMVMEILSRLNKEGMTIIMVTHDLSLAKYGTRIIYIKDGKIEEHE